jgi:hypothetical protein
MTVVESGAEGARKLVVCTDVQNIGQTAIAVTGAARIAEGFGLKRAPTRIPQVRGVRQPQCVHLATQSQFCGWPQIQRTVQSSLFIML